MSANTISFKNVGELKTDKKFISKKNEIPIGIKTPLNFGDKELFQMHVSLEDQIRDNLKNLILTNHGERLMRHDFGANLQEMTLEYGRDTFEIEVASRIKTAVAKYMPFVELETLTTSVDHRDNKNVAKVVLLIVFNIPRLNVRERKLEVVFFVAG